MDSLPQLAETVFLTDSGLETDLIFHHGYDLPDFAAFVLLDDASGVEALRRYYRDHATIARDAGVGFVLESPTWRASPDWGERLGYPPARLADVNRRAIALLVDLRAELENEVRPVVISGCVGPRGDGYRPAELMSADDAQRYHATQIATFAATEADLVTAMTITYVEEAIGIARAARQADVPVVISFTVETDGRLPNGSSLEDAVRAVDQATDRYPAYYMVNCAHPSHFSAVLDDGGDWTSRLRGVRANASRRSHAELDEAEDLDDGDPQQLAREYRQLREASPQLTVLGGCCGTDRRHVQEIATACITA